MVSILKMMDKPNSAIRESATSQLLEVICEKFPQDEILSRFGVQSIQICRPFHGSSFSVSPLGFLLLEQIEAAFEVTSI